MKKAPNNFALALGFLAVAYALLVVPDIVEILRQPHALLNQNDPRNAHYIGSFIQRDIVTALRASVYGSGVLMACAVLVELVDRIRWNALSPEERAGKVKL